MTRARTAALEPAEVAWLAVPAVATLLLLAIVLLGHPLGRAFFVPGSERFWPEAEVLPEPAEHARFVIAVLGAPLVACAVVASRRWPLRLPRRSVLTTIVIAQALVILLLAASLLAQRSIFLHVHALSPLPGRRQALFDLRTLAVAAAIAAAVGFTLPRRDVAARLAALGRETRRLRLACSAIAVLLIALWLMRAFNTERTADLAPGSNLIPWDMSETFAVLNGRTPLVDFHSQYAQLIPYLAAWTARVVGTSVGAWTGTMIAFSALALLAVHAVLRRVARNSLLALALFAPFVAASAFLAVGIVPLTIFSLWPMRYGGPYLLAWLTARHVDAVAPRRRALLLVAGGLVAINNLEFGLPALGGTLAALVSVDPPRSWRATRRLAADLAIGLVVAAALVSVLTLARAGSLPHFGLLLEFPRIYGIGGWVLEPMPTVGFHLVVYATFVAALAVAAVRAVRREEAVLTGMLAWSGIFGIGASSYYAGRSDQLNLISTFSAWALALSLLTVVVLRSLAGARRRPLVAELVVLFCWGLTVCALSQVPRPWTELQRLDRVGPPVYKQLGAVALVAATARPGERVAVLTSLGHRVAYDAGVVDVVPYASAEAMPTEEQLERTLGVMAREGVTHVYLDRKATYPALFEALEAAGYRVQRKRGRYMALTNAPVGL